MIRVHTILTLSVIAFAAGLLRADARPAVPHAGDPVLHDEHMAMLNLIRDTDATDVAVRDGLWSDGGTWALGSVPRAGAVVVIPKGRTVTLSDVVKPTLRGVRIDGRLQFASDRDTALTLDTLLVEPGGELTIGTAAAPIAAQHRATITFADTGPIDVARDPNQLGRGLIAHGAVTIHGHTLTPFVPLARAPKAGDTKLLLAQIPAGWNLGDRLVLPGTALGSNQDEQLKVLAVSGAELTVAPLAFDHSSPAADLPVHLANLTRNVTFASQSSSKPKAADRAGHVMFMHAPTVDVAFAAFENLGRTDKSRIIDDPQFDAQGVLVPGTGRNPRGRYAVHFHRTGIAANSRPARVSGCVVLDGAGWGFVNHSSNVAFEDNISFNVFGSGFVTEAGDEIGAFRHNLAIRSRGSGEGEDERKTAQDFAHEGDGFWFQGPGIAVEGNIAAGQAGSGFIFFTQGLRQAGLSITRYPVANLADAGWASRIGALDNKDPDKITDATSVPVIAVPIRGFKGNSAYACGTGYTVRFHRGSPAAARSVLEDSLAWNTGYGVRVRYTAHLVLRNMRLEGGFGKNGIFGIAGTLEGDQDIFYEGLRVAGWPTGIYVPEAGHHHIIGGYWNNVRSIYIPTPLSRGRTVEIAGDIRFGAASAEQLGGKPQFDIYADARFSPLLDSGYRDPNILFANDQTLLRFGPYAGKQLYYLEQAGDYVAFPRQPSAAGEERKRLGRADGVLPAELIGKTNRDLRREYGLAIGGALAPDATPDSPRIHGIVGAPAAYAPERIVYPMRTASMHDVTPTFVSLTGTGKKSAVKSPGDSPPLDLHPGWNLLTRRLDGDLQSFLIFGGAEAKPTMKAGKY